MFIYFVYLSLIRTFETTSRSYFRSGIKIKCILFCIPLTYSYLCSGKKFVNQITRIT